MDRYPEPALKSWSWGHGPHRGSELVEHRAWPPAAGPVSHGSHQGQAAVALWPGPSLPGTLVLWPVPYPLAGWEDRL